MSMLWIIPVLECDIALVASGSKINIINDVAGSVIKPLNKLRIQLV